MGSSRPPGHPGRRRSGEEVGRSATRRVSLTRPCPRVQGPRSRAEGDSCSDAKGRGSIRADPTARRPEAIPEGASVSSDRSAQRDNHDRGGNARRVRFFRRGTSLSPGGRAPDRKVMPSGRSPHRPMRTASSWARPCRWHRRKKSVPRATAPRHDDPSGGNDAELPASGGRMIDPQRISRPMDPNHVSRAVSS